MSTDEVQRLTDLLEELCHRSRRPRSDIERALGMGHGYLRALFTGGIDLRLRHILQLTHELGIDPAEFFRQAFPDEKLEPLPAPAAAAAPPAAERFEPEAFLRELLSRSIRAELADMLGMPQERLAAAPGKRPPRSRA